MASPIRVFERKVDIAFTAEQLAALRAEAALSGRTVSELIRAAVEAAYVASQEASWINEKQLARAIQAGREISRTTEQERKQS